MKQEIEERFTRYEIARIIGARALQIAMDAPILLKMTEDELKDVNYDALRIAEKELDEEVLPIAIHKPTPRKRGDKLGAVKEDTASDEEIVEKEKEVEKEITEDAESLGFTNPDDVDMTADDDSLEEQ